MSQGDNLKQINKNDIEDILALTPIQEGMLFHYLENKKREEYFQQLYLCIKGRIHMEVFYKAWHWVVSNNEMLRTFFIWDQVKSPVQVVLKKHTPEIHYWDMSSHEPMERSRLNYVKKLESKNKKLDLSKVPFRIELIKTENAHHELIISYHHILFDGWGMQIMLSEFFTAYQSLREGKEIHFVQKSKYKAFVQYIQKLNKDEQRSFWEGCFKDFNGSTTFDMLYKKKAQDKEVKINHITFSKLNQERLQSFSKKHQFTISALFYTAWGILMQKYNNVSDVIFGTTVSGRPSDIQGIQNTIGLFINTLPLRVKRDEQDTILDLIKKVSQHLLDRESYNNTSLADIKTYSKFNSQEKLFDSIVVIENYPVNLELFNKENDFQIESYHVDESTNYGITLTIETFKEINLKVSYRGGLYHEEMIQSLLNHFVTLIDKMIISYNEKIMNLSIISDNEKTTILEDFNNTGLDYDEELTIKDLFEMQVEKSPDEIALIFGDKGLTYRELNEKSNCLARTLKDSGLKPNKIVGLMVNRSIEIIIGILAIIKAGGAYLPIDPDYPAERIQYMLKDSEASMLLSKKDLIEKIYYEGKVIDIYDDESYGDNKENLLNINTKNDLAYVIYTSGSTGNPKGVMIENKAVNNFILGVTDKIDFRQGKSILALTTICFDIFLLETILALTKGLKVIIANEEEQKDLYKLKKLIVKQDIDMIQLTPSRLKFMLMDEGPNWLKPLKEIMVGGELLTSEICEDLLKRTKAKVYNMYGPTETTVWSQIKEISQDGINNIGKPIANTYIYILDQWNKILPFGVAGELCIGGDGLSRGYLNRPELTREKFIQNPYRPAERIYKTGDLARWLPDGNIEYIGRLDFQVKVRGFRIELGEIENQLKMFEGIHSAVALVKEDKNKDKNIIAYYTADKDIKVTQLKTFLLEKLPHYMIPDYFKRVEEIPITLNGKADRKKLLELEFSSNFKEIPSSCVISNTEKIMLNIWKDILEMDQLGLKDNFFDIGGNSLKIIRVNSMLKKTFEIEIPITTMFKYPTIQKLSQYIDSIKESNETNQKENLILEEKHTKTEENNRDWKNHVAVIGIAGRFPGASNVKEFWENLKNGVESISFFNDGELIQEGIEESSLSNPNYVKAKGILENVQYFDADFFKYSPKEAKMMDPQLRFLHECTWEALEDAGYNPFSYDGKIGMFAGASNNYYWISQVKGEFSDFEINILNDRDFLSTHVSYKLNLKGPSLTLQTACSTSLVALDIAMQNIQNQKCDMAVAGGVSFTYPQKTGYIYQDGMVNSPDGHCRAFDENAQGTVHGNGIGLVVLKSLQKAVEDKDHIYAVIKGCSINNDGFEKIGYTAPSIDGQVEVIKAAMEMAQVEPLSIGYVETHGTGTILGDPIEIEALTNSFFGSCEKHCAIGSVKTNVGHLDVAAGITGFIKTVLSIKNKMIPPSLNFNNPNPKIDFEHSPFYVNTKLSLWKNQGYPLRAGVSSFGIGGTNAHVILEEAPEREIHKDKNEYNLILLSAKTPNALEDMTKNMIEYLENNEEVNLDNIAYTLRVGRNSFPYRKMFISKTVKEAIDTLKESIEISDFKAPSRKIHTSFVEEGKIPVVFMFSGVGSQYVNMLSQLYDQEPYFQKELCLCFDIIKDIEPTMENIEELVFSNNTYEESEKSIYDIKYAQVIVFSFEYALAKTLIKWGIKPTALIGYSFGEYVAALISGVFSLKDALEMIVLRGELIGKIDKGSMLSVPLSREEIEKIMDKNLSISIDNGFSCVISGPSDKVKMMEMVFQKKKVICQYIKTSHALHSHMMMEVFHELKEKIKHFTLKKPQIPFISSVTGTWISNEEAQDPHYWAMHMVKTVFFLKGIETLKNHDDYVYIEIGPGNELCQLLTRWGGSKILKVSNFIKPQNTRMLDMQYIMNRIGQLWLYGVDMKWNSMNFLDRGLRIPLPTYPFEKKYYWIDQRKKEEQDYSSQWFFGKEVDIHNWFYAPSWKRSFVVSEKTTKEKNFYRFLIFSNDTEFDLKMISKLKEDITEVVVVKIGTNYKKIHDIEYQINPQNPEDFDKLVKELSINEKIPQGVLYLWSLYESKEENISSQRTNMALQRCFYSLIYLAQSFGRYNIVDEMVIKAVSNEMHEVYGGDLLYPEKSVILGPLKIIPLEYLNIKCFLIDIQKESQKDWRILESLKNEVLYSYEDHIVAYRAQYRWVPEIKRIQPITQPSSAFKERGTYIITGGLGGIGLKMAEYLGRTYHANLILVSRSPLPDRSNWDEYLKNPAAKEDLISKIRSIKALEDEDISLMVCHVDISNYEQMKKVTDKALGAFKHINGVIHTAGVAEYDGIIQNKKKANMEEILRPKVWGTLVLDQIFKEMDLDFFILCSSIASIIHHTKVGQVSYCSANEFIDAFTTYRASDSKYPVLSINWSDWKEVGMSVASAKEWGNKLQISNSEFILSEGIEPEEGMKVLELVVTNKFPQNIVHPEDLLHKLSQYEDSGAFTMDNILSESHHYQSSHERPKLSSDYAPPRTPVEKVICNIWEAVFGFEQIGIKDDFYELGGDSLKAINIIGKMNKGLKQKVGIQQFLSCGTIEKLTETMSNDNKTNDTDHDLILPAKVKEYYPLSSAQKRIYVLNQIEPFSTNYHMLFTWILEGSLYKEKLLTSIHKLFTRHEVLRTSFEMIDGELYQKINENVFIKVDRIPCKENEIDENIHKLRQPFDLKKAPLVKIALLEIEDSKNILVFDIHHIISDGISNNILVSDLMAIYNNQEIEEIKISYKDYCQWEQERKEKGYFNHQEQYWLNMLQNETPQLNLPYDFKRPIQLGTDGNTLGFSIREEETRLLKEIARKENITLYSLLFAAVNVFLSKLSSKENIILGIPIAGRNREELQNVAGIFINTLAIKSEPLGDKNFNTYVKEVYNTLLESFQHGEYPFNDLIEALGVERSLNRNPLFDIMFNYQNMETPKIHFDGLTYYPYGFKTKQTQFDLSIDAIEISERLNFNFEYSTILFKENTIKRFMTYFKNILHEIIVHPTKKIMDMDGLTKEEINDLIENFNQTASDYPKDELIHRLFEKQAEKTPHNTAIYYNETKMTYEVLNRKANCLAKKMKNEGIGQGEIVPILIEPCTEMIIGILAILKTGAAYLPLDVNTPKEKLIFMLTDTKATFLLTKKLYLELIKGLMKEKLDLNYLLMDGMESDVVYEENLNVDMTSDSLIYVMYTSGTTGMPKGVLTRHRNIMNYCSWLMDYFKIGPGFNYLSLTQFTFDPSAGDFFSTLLSGATLYIVDKNTMLDKSALRHYIKEHHIHIINEVPGLISEILYEEEKLDSIKYIISGGDKLSENLKDNLLDIGYEVYNVYGPTETTIDCLFWRCEKGKVFIGKPIWNTKIYVVDSYNRLTPKGVIGELCVSGEGVSSGYLNHPSLTEEKFILNPFEENKVMYKTGDLVKINENNQIEFIGRKDSQVKLNGIRIETEEIETRILKMDGISDVTVCLLKDEKRGDYLCAYYTSLEEISQESFIEYLSSFFIDSLIPKEFIKIKKMPLTVNGKVDKKALPKPVEKVKQDIETARNEIEIFISRIWEEILGVDSICIHDNFFHMGGNSLMILKVKSKLEKRYPNVQVVDLFTYPSISKLSNFIAKVHELAEKEIRIKRVPMPEEYFKNPDSSLENSFYFHIEDDLFYAIKKLSQDLSVDTWDVILSLYFYLLHQTSDEYEISIQTILAHQNRGIGSLTVDFHCIQSIENLILYVKNIKNEFDKKGLYSTEQIAIEDKAREKNCITPLFYTKQFLRQGMSMWNLFDVVLEIDEKKEGLMIIFSFNKEVLNHKKMEEFITMFARILEELLGRIEKGYE